MKNFVLAIKLLFSLKRHHHLHIFTASILKEQKIDPLEGCAAQQATHSLSLSLPIYIIIVIHDTTTTTTAATAMIIQWLFIVFYFSCYCHCKLIKMCIVVILPHR
jgi:hypothetical protein